MREIGIIKRIDIESCKNPYYRTAVRAIIFKSGFLYLLKSKKYGEYKFPGGGVEDGESLLEALDREIYEEAGLILKNIREFGKVLEIRKAKDNIHDGVIMTNYYFIAEVKEESSYRNFDHYELEYGYTLEKVKINDAISNNVSINDNEEIPWNERETFVLKYIKSNLEGLYNVK